MKQILIALMVIVFFSCNNQSPKIYTSSNDNIHTVVVSEVIQTSQYSYLKVIDNDVEQWLAATYLEAKPGEIFYYEKGMEMPNFHSKELNRDFETIIFVDKLSSDPATFKMKAQSTPPGSAKAKVEKKEINIDRAKDGISIAELFAKKESYNNQTVKIKGQVVKYSPGIMNKNWFHIQDGTDFNGSFDLTVNTKTDLKVGDIVTVEGKIALNKDFGYGYVYDVIIEDATIK